MKNETILRRTTRYLNAFSGFGDKVEKAKSLVQSKDSRRGIVQLNKLAQAGDAEAQLALGEIYLQGQHVPLNPREAVKWLKMAAANGSPEACFKLAVLCHNGFVVSDEQPSSILSNSLQQKDPDNDAALHWAAQAAEAGHADAQALVAYILRHGPEHLQDHGRAEALYRQSAEAGSVHGLQGYGLFLFQRNTAETDRVEAIRYFRAAAEKGSAQACLMLGTIAEYGEGEEADENRAFQYFMRAAEAELSPAQLKVGIAYYQGRGVEKDVSIAETWLRKAAMAGENEAAALVGDINLQGNGGVPNFIEAVAWYRRAIEGGHSGAAVTLGQMLYNGIGIARSQEEAGELFELAAQRGNAQGAQLAQLLKAVPVK